MQIGEQRLFSETLLHAMFATVPFAVHHQPKDAPKPNLSSQTRTGLSESSSYRSNRSSRSHHSHNCPQPVKLAAAATAHNVPGRTASRKRESRAPLVPLVAVSIAQEQSVPPNCPGDCLESLQRSREK